MLKEKSIQLITNLNDIIKKYSRNDKVRKIIIDEFTKRNMRGSNAVNILNEKLELSTLDIDNNKDLILLFVFAQGMYSALTFREDEESEAIGEISDYTKIIPSNYFTKIELENFSDYKLEIEEKQSEEVIFPNMNRIAPGFYSGYISAQFLAKLDASNELIYNFKTQRDPVIDVYGMKRIHLNKKNAKEIMEGLLSGDQFPTTIVINVLHDGTDEVVYDEKSKNLVVISGTKNIVDGFHRKVGTVLAMEQNPDLDFNWLLVVINYSEIKAQKYMVEINKQQPMKQEHIKNMDKASLGNVVVDAIIDIDTSEFATKIKDTDKEIEFGGLTKKSIISQAIEECYKQELTNRLKLKSIAKHIANVMDHIIGVYVDEFVANPEETKKVSVINHKNIFYGYVALSRELYEVKDWEEKLEEALVKVDFSLDNPFWNDIKFFETNLSKATRNNLYKFFRGLI